MHRLLRHFICFGVHGGLQGLRCVRIRHCASRLVRLSLAVLVYLNINFDFFGVLRERVAHITLELGNREKELELTIRVGQVRLEHLVCKTANEASLVV